MRFKVFSLNTIKCMTTLHFADQTTLFSFVLETVDYLWTLNSLWRVMNSSKPLRTSNADDIQALRDGLEYFRDWYGTAGDTCISKVTYNNLQCAVEGLLTFVEMVDSPSFQHKHPGSYVVPRRISQDPVESHFSKHRSMAGGGSHPTYMQYVGNNETIMANLAN